MKTNVSKIANLIQQQESELDKVTQYTPVYVAIDDDIPEHHIIQFEQNIKNISFVVVKTIEDCIQFTKAIKEAADCTSNWNPNTAAWTPKGVEDMFDWTPNWNILPNGFIYAPL